jgi:adhesin/invasin
MSSRRFRLASLLLPLLVVAGCYNADKYGVQSPTAPDGTPADEILAVSASPETVQADGISRATITARIDSRSTVKNVTFETSRGSLVGATNGKLTMTADGAGVATAELQSEPTPGAARVTVTVGPNVPNVGNVIRVLDVPFTAVNADQLLTLETSSPAIGADGFSTATITARVTVNGNRAQQVKFSTSLGKLAKTTTGAGAETETITADVQGVATIFLRSEATVGTAIVTAEMLGFSRQITVAFQPVSPNDIITLRADPSSVAADGSTGNGTRLTATISPFIPADKRTVTFSTTNGEFVGGNSAVADGSNVAQATLKSSSAGTAVVSATVNGVVARTNVEFIPAVPDTITLVSRDSTIDKGGADDTLITVTLTRVSGQVSDNTVVTYSAVDSAGASIGRFSQIMRAAEDPNDTTPPKALISTARFDPDDTAATGTVTITATVGSVRGTLTIQIR